MADKMTIRELMSVPAADHDLNWLRQSLQAAMELELATLPPYLCAEWSVKNESDPVRASIHNIVRDEMLHFGLAANMLTAVGRVPAINTLASVPMYPGELPGGVHSGLIVSLRALSREAAETFMQIELPERGAIAFELADQYPTIGAFYSAIQEAFESLQPPLSADEQPVGPLGLFKIQSVEDARRAIQRIKIQGEGAEGSPEETPGDLGHYYRFKEIHVGRRLRFAPETGKWEFSGDPWPIPEVWPMAEVPKGGYRKEDVPDRVWQLIHEFDQIYTDLLTQLQSVWAGNPGSLGSAVSTMFELPEKGKELMKISIQNGTGNYGPCFRLV